MGLTENSTGSKALFSGINTVKLHSNDITVALAGNPNVGKSTVFNELTGLHQHTGNWTGKTVCCAAGRCHTHGKDYIIVDLPGTYSLMPHSAEEEAARDFILFADADVTVVVCDATLLERNLTLVMQTAQITSNIVLCVNLMDEAAKKCSLPDLKRLEINLGIPVVAASARIGRGIDELMQKVREVADGTDRPTPTPLKLPKDIEEAIDEIEPYVNELNIKNAPARFTALKILEDDTSFAKALKEHLKINLAENKRLALAVSRAKKLLKSSESDYVEQSVAQAINSSAKNACRGVYKRKAGKCFERDRKIDKILTGRATGIPIMLIMLTLVFWLTISAANYPSQWLSTLFFAVRNKFDWLLSFLHSPQWLAGLLSDGVYKTLAWVVSVMLPPMAIFFPLFTLLEDLGYLPRIAFNLDHRFQKAGTCGKQALTMAMGFGCNAAGVVGCRIIDSPRERLIATLTNNFAPCNGRFPTLISIISIFFVGIGTARFSSLKSAALLTAIIALGVIMTFVTSKLLSKTILKGVPSSFILELPPYRKPQIFKVILRSITDRTLFVLGRAAAVAAPAGAVIWILANVKVGNLSLLTHCTEFLDPFAKLFGLDGVILMGFILGFPANEIVLPIITMAYLSNGSLTELNSLPALQNLLVENGWTWATAVSVMLFSVMHWPCSTTCMTVKKETQSLKWTFASFAIPTVTGFAVCFLFNLAVKLFSVI